MQQIFFTFPALSAGPGAVITVPGSQLQAGDRISQVLDLTAGRDITTDFDPVVPGAGQLIVGSSGLSGVDSHQILGIANR